MVCPNKVANLFNTFFALRVEAISSALGLLGRNGRRRMSGRANTSQTYPDCKPGVLDTSG